MKTTLLLFSAVSLPISMYITHSLLVATHADRLLFFLFWVNIPIIFIVHAITEALRKEQQK